jgi:predicted nucleic acid-binding protein
MTVLVDTDALIGLADAADGHYHESTHIAQELTDRCATIFILPTTLAEFALVASGKIGMRATQQIVDLLLRSYTSVDIDQALVAGAKSRYDVQTSKEHSLFDCFVMEAAKRLAADCIFSYDKGYRQNGFTLVQHYLESVSPSVAHN